MRIKLPLSLLALSISLYPVGSSCDAQVSFPVKHNEGDMAKCQRPWLGSTGWPTHSTQGEMHHKMYARM